MDAKNKINASKITDVIISEFYDLLETKYSKEEKCLVTKLYSSDFQTLKNIINKHIDVLLKP